jgi:hypothetical protein
MSGAPAYDRIGLDYAEHRRADPRIATRIWVALGDARLPELDIGLRLVCEEL